MQWLAIGVFFNGIAQIPFALVQGSGRPDITGKLHLWELPAYGLLLWVLIHTNGIEGAAIAWTARVVVDALILFGFSYRILRAEPQNLRRFILPLASAILLLTLGGVLLTLGGVPMNVYAKISYALLTLFAFGFVTWFALLDPSERLYARSRIRAY